MRILHLATFLQGGAGRVITDLAIAQHRAGHEVRLVTSLTAAAGYGNYQRYLDELAAAGVGVDAVDSMFARRHADNLAVVRLLGTRYPVGGEPDVIHSHAAVPGLVALVFAGARRARIAMIQTMHGWGQVKTVDQVSADVTVLNLMDRVVVASRHSLDTLVSLGVAPSKLAMVSYGVGPDAAEPDDRDADLIVTMARARRGNCCVIACVGTIGPRKNQALLVDAVARLDDLPVLCVFVGDGDVDGLRRAVERTGRSDRFSIHGYSHAARRIAASADLLVLPSRSEGQPISVLEAFCDGTLVAASDIPELIELVGPDVGFRFDAASAEALAGLLRSVATLPNSARRTLREHARALYLSRFTTTSMAARYAAHYDALVPSAGRRESSAA